MLVELPTVTTEPPDSTNCLICGIVFSSVTRPIQPRNSSGTVDGSICANPPRPPRPVAVPRRVAPSVNTITSNLLRKFPASRVCGYTSSYGNSYCSNSQRVQPDG